MAFGKKKSILPLVGGNIHTKTSVTERKVYPQGQVPDMDAMKSISISRAGQFAAGICEARGYPKDSLPNIAINIMWLESRGLAALANMAKDIFEHWNENLKQRGPQQLPNNSMTCACPLFASAFTGNMVDQLVEAGPGIKANFICGGPVYVLLPRLSDHAIRHKVILNIEVHPTDRYIEDPTGFVIHQDDVAVLPGQTKLHGPANILIRILPPSYLPPKEAFLSQRPKCESVSIQAAMLDLILDARQKTGFRGPLPFENGFSTPNELKAKCVAPPSPAGLTPLAPATRTFFNQIIDNNHDLTQAFSPLSKGDRSGLNIIVFGDAEGKDYSNTILATGQNTPAGAFYRQCEKIGWMALAPHDPITQHGILAYQVTKTGRMGLSLLLVR